MKLPVDLPVLHLPVHVEAAMGPYLGTSGPQKQRSSRKKPRRSEMATAEQTRARKKKAEAGSVHEQCE